MNTHACQPVTFGFAEHSGRTFASRLKTVAAGLAALTMTHAHPWPSTAATTPLTPAPPIINPPDRDALGWRSVSPGVSTLGISAGLGLVDLRIEPPGPGGQGGVEGQGGHGAPDTVEIRFNSPAGEPIAVPLILQPDGSWTARLHTGRPETEATVWVRPPGGHAQPFAAVTLHAVPHEDWATPDWAKGAVWYQIFPERFRNANPDNDPPPGLNPHTYNPGWSSNWWRVTPDEVEAYRARRGDPSAGVGEDPSRRPAPIAGLVWSRRYGGDLQGVAAMLGHIRALGVDAIYLTPVFQAASLHKYDAADYRHIDDTLAHPGSPALSTNPEERWSVPGESPDPATWTWTEADRYVLDVFIPTLRQHGLRVMFDGVWNHTGREFFAFRDLLRHGQDSPFADWYAATFAGPEGAQVPVLGMDEAVYRFAPGQLVGWKAWDRRNGSLPAFRQTPEGDLAPGPKAHIFDITRRWMDPHASGTPSDGIDGWRLDVAGEIGTTFWSDWRRHVKSINPDALLIAEIWHPATGSFGRSGFDGQMNYPLAEALTGWLGRDPEMTSERLGTLLGRLLVNHPAVDLVQFNLLGSHDTDRIASILLNPGRRYDQGTGHDGRADGYNPARPPDRIYRLAMLGVAVLSTYVGAPMIYAGDELGMHGPDDPHNRKPLPWPNLPPNENADERAISWVTVAHQQWLSLRRDPNISHTLRYGAVKIITDTSPTTFAFIRHLNARRVLVVVNRADREIDVTRFLPSAGAHRLPVGHGTVAGWHSGGNLGSLEAGVWWWDEPSDPHSGRRP